ncbi:sodium:proton antiporter [Pediococcus stilesii]|uniref:Sodium:proton antiporter n=1 Tax=Pediococcus stilesii TaxID=331679 RepID=A0A5R9BUG7_9LACO|nr:monovalent cation:proton antiporter-2 (CPA2) family protein [Pediococcus stilesii]TLQ03582.1 sodium:proton antiporter [Pediococcus stilesii]
MEFVGVLVLILVLTLLAGHFAQRIGFPAVVGQLLIGIVLGPGVLGLIHTNELISVFSEIGVIILMFLAGLESDLKMLQKYIKPALIVAVLGVILPIALVGGASLLFGVNPMESLFIGVIFSATSVSISVEVLKEYRTLNTKEGATILGAAVADDIIGVLLLGVMIALTSSKTGSNSNIGLAIFYQILFFVGVYVIGKWVVPVLMRLSDRLYITASRTVMSMIICLGLAWLADVAGLSGAIGAFFAGVAVSLTDQDDEINESIEPIGYAIFIPVFFVSVGLSMTFSGLQSVIGLIVTLTVLATLTKLLGCGLGAYMSGFDLTSSGVIGAGMISRGEMALITLQIGYGEHLMSETYYSAIVLVIVIVTLVAPFILKDAIRRNKAAMNNA